MATNDVLEQITNQLQQLTNGQERMVDAQQKTAVLLERMSGRIDGLDGRMKVQEDAVRSAPAAQALQAQTQVFRSQAWGQWLAVGLATLAIIITLATHLSVH